MYPIHDNSDQAISDGHDRLEIVDIEVTCNDDITVITIIGELDVSNSALLFDCLDEAMDAGIASIVVDIERMDFLDSSGLAVLLRAHERMVAAGGTLAIFAPMPNVARLLNVVGLGRLLNLQTAEALHDPLTGLANRALFVDGVENALARRARDQRPVSVLFVDLDDFKLINDTMGHGVGDHVLQQTAERLNACVRPSDMVARFGGDEFALLLADADVATAANIASRVVNEFVRPFRIFDREIVARASVGIAVSLGEVTTEDLIAGADTAMYVSKSNGKARYEFFEPAMRDIAIDRSALRIDLEWATTRAELAIDYQPIIEFGTGSLSGFEALVRWDHPTRGRLGPDQFIDLAEQSGLIIGLGGWVLRAACSQVAVWQKMIGRELTIAVNISARQLQDPGLTSKIRTALAVSDLRPHSLVLEITESATVEDTESAIGVLNALKALGVRIAIDDFGTGYSSLSYLRRFPVDQLKVDRTFISELVTNPEDLAIVSSVINLGHSLGLSVVAEGVESAEQLQRLNEMSCDQGQGFIWRRPASAQDVSHWLELSDGTLASV